MDTLTLLWLLILTLAHLFHIFPFAPHLRNGPREWHEVRPPTLQPRPSRGFAIPVSVRTYTSLTELWRLLQRHCRPFADGSQCRP